MSRRTWLLLQHSDQSLQLEQDLRLTPTWLISASQRSSLSKDTEFVAVPQSGAVAVATVAYACT